MSKSIYNGPGHIYYADMYIYIYIYLYIYIRTLFIFVLHGKIVSGGWFCKDSNPNLRLWRCAATDSCTGLTCFMSRGNAILDSSCFPPLTLYMFWISLSEISGRHSRSRCLKLQWRKRHQEQRQVRCLYMTHPTCIAVCCFFHHTRASDDDICNGTVISCMHGCIVQFAVHVICSISNISVRHAPQRPDDLWKYLKAEEFDDDDLELLVIADIVSIHFHSQCMQYVVQLN